MHIDEGIDQPAKDVRRSREGRRIHAQCLADIRKASKLTQKQVAAVLDTDQGTISRIERRDDLLLSTLRQYLAATGAEHPKIVAEKDGVEISLDLDTFA
nr:helix-turn-helix transcriptional regulator [Rhodococcus sp. 06-621-2]